MLATEHVVYCGLSFGVSIFVRATATLPSYCTNYMTEVKLSFIPYYSTSPCMNCTVRAVPVFSGMYCRGPMFNLQYIQCLYLSPILQTPRDGAWCEIRKTRAFSGGKSLHLPKLRKAQIQRESVRTKWAMHQSERTKPTSSQLKNLKKTWQYGQREWIMHSLIQIKHHKRKTTVKTKLLAPSLCA